MKVSVVVPFYKGNEYLLRLIQSIEKAFDNLVDVADYEVIIVNDSPSVPVVLPSENERIYVITNEKNLGIQGARINGFKRATGDWILFLDQDDEIVEDGFVQQIALTKDSDVVVGNGRYIMGNVDHKIYNNHISMKYLIQKKRFIEIRNLIPSPGECLIKKTAVPQIWINNILKCNGADDWLLWLLLFNEGAKFSFNEKMVYIHHDSKGENLSSNLDKMRESSVEMLEVLKNNKIFLCKELKTLEDAIYFKYYQDTKTLTVGKMFRYIRIIYYNILYRLRLNYYRRK